VKRDVCYFIKRKMFFLKINPRIVFQSSKSTSRATFSLFKPIEIQTGEPCINRPPGYFGVISRASSGSATPVYSHALTFGDSPAVVDDETSYTFTQLHNFAQRLAGHIGPRPGEQIAFLTPNSGVYVAVQWAVWMCGAVAVPLCKTHPSTTISYYLEDSRASMVVVSEGLKEKVTDLGVEILVVEECDQVKSGDAVMDVRMEAEQPAMILYTSGTTGPPKGVVLTHSNLESQVSCLVSAWKWTSTDSLLHVLPLHHTHGIVNCLMCPLTVGAKVTMMDNFDAGRVWQHLTKDAPSVNLFMAVPTIYAKLVEYYKKKLSGTDRATVKERCQENIRLMVSGSAALPTPVLHDWRDLTGHTLLERYGMTEIGMALSNPLEGERRPGSVGRPLPGVEVRIASWKDNSEYEMLAEGNHQSIKPSDESEEGELLVRGPNVFKEYLNKPEATKKEFTTDGWFRTGDTSKVEDGLFRILGRTSVDIIKSGGYKLSALDVERVLLTHPDIQDVAVVGVDDPVWGQKVAAVLVLNDQSSLDLEGLKMWAKEKMAKYWIPTELKLVNEMPRNAMGKVNKKELLKNMFQ